MEFKLIENEAGLKTTLTSIKRSGTTLRGNVQGAIEFAGAHFTAHGDTVHFNSIQNALPKSLNRVDALLYAKARFGLSAIEVNGVWTFKKNKEAEPVASLSEVMWDEMSKKKADKADYTLEQMKKLLKRKAESTTGVDSDCVAMAALCLKTIVEAQQEDAELQSREDDEQAHNAAEEAAEFVEEK